MKNKQTKEGKTIITLSMPKEAAERLLAAWNKDPNCLAKLKVVDVKIHPEIIQEKNVDKV